MRKLISKQAASHAINQTYTVTCSITIKQLLTLYKGQHVPQ